MKLRWIGVLLAFFTMPIMTLAATDSAQQRTVLASIELEGLRVERGYAPSPLGQIHYQDVGVAQAGNPSMCCSIRFLGFISTTVVPKRSSPNVAFAQSPSTRRDMVFRRDRSSLPRSLIMSARCVPPSRI